jgi:hypothetical protein
MTFVGYFTLHLSFREPKFKTVDIRFLQIYAGEMLTMIPVSARLRQFDALLKFRELCILGSIRGAG